jgi:hypothetical protein
MLQVYRIFCHQIKTVIPQSPGKIYLGKRFNTHKVARENYKLTIPWPSELSTFKMEAEDSYEMLITTYHTTWCLIQRPQSKTPTFFTITRF